MDVLVNIIYSTLGNSSHSVCFPAASLAISKNGSYRKSINRAINAINRYFKADKDITKNKVAKDVANNKEAKNGSSIPLIPVRADKATSLAPSS